MKTVEFYETKYKTLKNDIHNFSYRTRQKEKFYSLMKNTGKSLYKYLYIVLPFFFILLFIILRPSVLLTKKQKIRWIWCCILSIILSIIVIFALYKMNWWSFHFYK